MTREEAWLIEWFASRATLPPSADARLQTNYFESGWIDSLGIIGLIEEIESHFALRFEERHFQDRRFSTIGGLGAIITELDSPARDGASEA